MKVIYFVYDSFNITSTPFLSAREFHKHDTNTPYSASNMFHTSHQLIFGSF